MIVQAAPSYECAYIKHVNADTLETDHTTIVAAVKSSTIEAWRRIGFVVWHSAGSPGLEMAPEMS